VRIRVIYKNGNPETLTGEWAVVEGTFLDRLLGAGFEYFFTKGGFYDAWGGSGKRLPRRG
jgi:hypothetical protein